MRIKSIFLRDFKGFRHLTIHNIPKSARLVVLAGPNGFGKSSLFDAFRLWSGRQGNRFVDQGDYYSKVSFPIEGKVLAAQPVGHFDIHFHDGQLANYSVEAQKAFYFRSVYSNDPELTINNLFMVGSSLKENRFYRMIDTDAAVTLNYQRMVSDAFDDAFVRELGSNTLDTWRKGVIGELRDAVQVLFPELILNGLGSPLRDANFRFTKDVSGGFNYKSLSDGEKVAFDLILDLIVKRREHYDTVFCIDEPEAHLNSRVHGILLR